MACKEFCLREEDMRVAGLKWGIGFCVSLIALVPAHAQPLVPKTESIESLVDNSDYVSIATLVKFRCEEQGTDPDKHDATIAIEEELHCCQTLWKS